MPVIAPCSIPSSAAARRPRASAILSEAPTIIEHMFEINPCLGAGIGELDPEPDWSQAVGPGYAPEDWNGPDLDVVDARLDWSLAMDGGEDRRLAEELHLDAPSLSGGDWSPEHGPGMFPPPWDEPAPDRSPLIAEWSWADAPPGAGLAAALDELPAALLDD